ncbi:MAG: dehydrogenase, partial [Verrucomicrobiae bacterium]|nr:dehydrogenase [Verrucomicrobiae bacterium]
MQHDLPRLFLPAACCFIQLLSSPVSAQEKYETHTDLPSNIQPTPSPARTPQEALESFQLADGFSIELVASEPLIEDPVLIDWDMQGRLWVCEMRGFMTDIDATDQFAKVGRISVLEDTNGDGKMDKATRFLEDLVLPRAMRVFQEGLLVAEHDKLWFVPDADGNLVPEDKILIDAEYATSGSVEHRPNGLLLGLDNWIYNSRSNKRYKRKDGEWITDATENRGQWGITMDDYGRLFYNFHWSQLHCDIAPPDALTRNPNFKPKLSVNATVSNDQLVFPIRMNTAVNRGYRPGVLDNEGKLLKFASACSPWIYRGGAFPSTFNGNAFVCAPGANTIKRNLIFDKGITVSGINAYPDRDFLASTDERFRPVSLSGGPDGALYVVDMYRGIIQQADFMTPFLRRESERRKLEQPIHLGR